MIFDSVFNFKIDNNKIIINILYPLLRRNLVICTESELEGNINKIINNFVFFVVFVYNFAFVVFLFSQTSLSNF
jgi:hypothetical protein